MSVFYKTEFEKGVLISNFEKRGWSRATDDSWDFFWATTNTVKMLFNPSSTAGTDDASVRFRLSDNAVLNHFPNHYELTRKDLLAKNCKRYRKALEKEGKTCPEVVPLTFQLPQEYSLFVDYATRAPGTPVWIAKPVGRSQGKGIFLFTKLHAIKQFQPSSKKESTDSYVVSRYIHNPMLVGGKKFDLRIYVLVTSYKPLKVWLYREGFARFCNVKYKFSTREKDLENAYMHLTNVAIQKHNDDYNSAHGGKWTLKNLRLWMESTKGAEATNACFRHMELIIYHSLKAVQPVMISDRHCFEVYGFDLMIDDYLNPWLLEVNASPALTSTTESDRLMKYGVINDTLDIVMPASNPKLAASSGSGSSTSLSAAGVGSGAGGDGGGGGGGGAGGGGAGVGAGSSVDTGPGHGPGTHLLKGVRRVGGYELLYDESVDIALEKQRELPKKSTGSWK